MENDELIKEWAHEANKAFFIIILIVIILCSISFILDNIFNNREKKTLKFTTEQIEYVQKQMEEAR